MCVLLAYEAPADSLIVRLSTAFSNNDSLEIHILFHELIADAVKYHYASGNLWQNYLTHFILSNENFFSLACEGKTPPESSLKNVALHDFEAFLRLFNLQNEHMHYINNFTGCEGVNQHICEISKAIAEAGSALKMYDIVTNFYKRHGTGKFAFCNAFRLNGQELLPVEHTGTIRLCDIVGYDSQKRELTANTEAFINGKPANNVLLYGDGGTGKSSSVKAILNEYADRRLRIIEVFKHQFRDMLTLSEILRDRNYKFIVFIDDLSFEEGETDYKFLKAIIEGGIETRPNNILIYATSNRRHLVREVWSDRNDMEHNGDIHRSDTVEEKLSLAARFGVAINYSSPRREEYHAIVKALAQKAGIAISDELLKLADRWEIRHGGMSGRTAVQFIDYMMGQK